MPQGAQVNHFDLLCPSTHSSLTFTDPSKLTHCRQQSEWLYTEGRTWAWQFSVGGEGNFLSWHMRAYSHWLSLWTNHQVSDGKTLGLTLQSMPGDTPDLGEYTLLWQEGDGWMYYFCVRAVSFQTELCDTVQPLSTHEILKQPHKTEKPTARSKSRVRRTTVPRPSLTSSCISEFIMKCFLCITAPRASSLMSSPEETTLQL